MIYKACSFKTFNFSMYGFSLTIIKFSTDLLNSFFKGICLSTIILFLGLILYIDLGFCNNLTSETGTNALLNGLEVPDCTP